MGRQLEAGDQEAERQQGESDDEIGQLDGGGFVHAVGLQGIGREDAEGGGRLGSGVEDQVSAEQGRDGGAEGVERLREVQAAGRGARGAEDSDIRVGRDPQHSNAAREDQESREEQAIGGNEGRGQEQQRAGTHDEDSRDHSALVAYPVDQLSGWN